MSIQCRDCAAGSGSFACRSAIASSMAAPPSSACSTRGCAARTRFFRTRPASASSVRSSRSPNAAAREENASKIPNTLSSCNNGNTTTDLTPSRRDASPSARGSTCASSQRCTWRVRMHSPDRPDPPSSRAPNSGAVGPLLARQTISPSRCRTIAAPDAPVARHACSTISCNTISSARSAESSRESPGPLEAANLAVSSARSVSCKGWLVKDSPACREIPLAPEKAGGEGSRPDVG